ncbi:hemerythrin domain-containing protein [Dactylosporangium cerinum]
MIAVHECIEEEIVHPITRHLDPAEHLAEQLLDEERRISDALSDAARVDAAAGLGRTDGLVVLHGMLTTHIRRETREEFPGCAPPSPPVSWRTSATWPAPRRPGSPPRARRGQGCRPPRW